MKVILLRQPLVYLRSALIGFSPRRQKLFLTVAYSTTSERGGTKGGGGGVEGGKGRKRKYCIFIGCISF